MKGLLVIGASALVFAASASAAGTAWTRKDMTAALKALGYPKPHPVRLACQGASTQVSLTSWSPVRCVATYRHHRRRVVSAQWRGGGGWICAGAKPATCKILRRGFVPGDIAGGQPDGAAALAAVGYMANHYDAPQPYRYSGTCPAATPPAYSRCYALDTGGVEVVVTIKPVKVGYVFTAAQALLP